MGELSGKNALVTGASRGIGNAIARRFSAEGANVVLVASRLGTHGSLSGTLADAAAEIESAGGRAAPLACNLADATARGDLLARAAALFGPIDILVNNAAGARMALPSLATTKERAFMFDLNVNAPIDLAQQAIAGMKERGGGWILNISSATRNQPALPYPDSKMAAWMIGPYGASKIALERYTGALGHELAEHEIFVNAMAPVSIVLTQGADYVRDIARKHPHMAEPVEMMVEAAMELCTNRHVAQVVFSRDIVHAVGRKVMSLDGKTVLGDAFLAADLEGTA